MNGEDQFIGIVRLGQLSLVFPESEAGKIVRLTGISPQAAMAPEAREIVLRDYEGKAIMIKGRENGDWIYSAAIIDHGGPILSALVQKVFGK